MKNAIDKNLTRVTTLQSVDDIRPLWLIEKEIIEQAINLCGGNIPKAAHLLQISPSTIYRKKVAWEDLEKNKSDYNG